MIMSEKGDEKTVCKNVRNGVCKCHWELIESNLYPAVEYGDYRKKCKNPNPIPRPKSHGGAVSPPDTKTPGCNNEHGAHQKKYSTEPVVN
jgi:hypothetical protein